MSRVTPQPNADYRAAVQAQLTRTLDERDQPAVPAFTPPPEVSLANLDDPPTAPACCGGAT